MPQIDASPAGITIAHVTFASKGENMRIGNRLRLIRKINTMLEVCEELNLVLLHERTNRGNGTRTDTLPNRERITFGPTEEFVRLSSWEDKHCQGSNRFKDCRSHVGNDESRTHDLPDGRIDPGREIYERLEYLWRIQFSDQFTCRRYDESANRTHPLRD